MSERKAVEHHWTTYIFLAIAILGPVISSWVALDARIDSVEQRNSVLVQRITDDEAQSKEKFEDLKRQVRQLQFQRSRGR